MTTFAEGITSLVDVKVSEGGQIYYLTHSRGEVVHIEYKGAPTMTVAVNGAHGPIAVAPESPLQVGVSFDPGTAGTLTWPRRSAGHDLAGAGELRRDRS